MSQKEGKIVKGVHLSSIQALEAKIDRLGHLLEGRPNESKTQIWHPKCLVEMQISNESNFVAEFMTEEAVPSSLLDLRFPSWTYYWQRNFVGNAFTEYYGSVFVIRKDTGAILTWNLIESASIQATDLPPWSKSPYYNHQTNSSQVSFGTGKTDSIAHHVSSCINCYANWGSISYTWSSDA
ncbi:hypothetical protein PUR31_13365 [Pseudomonas mosselii]|jgi:hypothetical protein|uniref:hypothetical protein n=1 Tax=unclassified Pseudomonas TaxID=196821 RepID=UPI0020C3764E|nr:MULTISPECIES: hypothetical protein [unclassified Pseudomonas]MCP8633689.1 hypothetical protein [Pseudomonas sp. DVZ6]MDD7785075.1 hypothetical protein [Pseudomonas sp. DVZ24]